MKAFKILFAATLLLASLQGLAQKKPAAEKDNLLFMLRQPEHINQAIKTIHDMEAAGATTLKVGKIAIIVCGEAVVKLTSSEATAWVQKLSGHRNVSLIACGLSLDKFEKTKADLVPGIDYTENGFIHAFELQKQGYLSVEL